MNIRLSLNCSVVLHIGTLELRILRLKTLTTKKEKFKDCSIEVSLGGDTPQQVVILCLNGIYVYTTHVLYIYIYKLARRDGKREGGRKGEHVRECANSR